MSTLEGLPKPVQDALERDMTIDITTTGRRTGQARRIEIWFLNIEGTVYIAGTPGPRDWFANLAANPSLIFHLKQTTTADLAATATVVRDGHERRRVLEAAESSWYRTQTGDVDELVASAPLVRVTFD